MEQSFCLMKDKQDLQEKEILRLSEETNYLKCKLPAELLNEFQSRMDRNKNVIISGVKETRSGSVDERRGDDEREVKDILDKIGLNLMFSNVTRVGKVTANRRRLLRATFCDNESRNQVLRKARTLHLHAAYKHVYINPDRTPMEQAEFAKLRQELKDRREAGEDVAIFRNKIMHMKDINHKQTFHHGF